MKILVAVDGSAYTKRMLAHLGACDEWLGPAHQYTVVHSTPPIPPGAAHMLARDMVKLYYGDESEKVFKPIRTFFRRHGVDAAFSAQVGYAGAVISTMARKGKFDLVVMGSHGHGALGNLVLGSVATKVLAGCSVPVLLVR